MSLLFAIQILIVLHNLFINVKMTKNFKIIVSHVSYIYLKEISDFTVIIKWHVEKKLYFHWYQMMPIIGSNTANNWDNRKM